MLYRSSDPPKNGVYDYFRNPVVLTRKKWLYKTPFFWAKTEILGKNQVLGKNSNFGQKF